MTPIRPQPRPFKKSLTGIIGIPGYIRLVIEYSHNLSNANSGDLEGGVSRQTRRGNTPDRPGAMFSLRHQKFAR